MYMENFKNVVQGMWGGGKGLGSGVRMRYLGSGTVERSSDTFDKLKNTIMHFWQITFRSANFFSKQIVSNALISPHPLIPCHLSLILTTSHLPLPFPYLPPYPTLRINVQHQFSTTHWYTKG